MERVFNTGPDEYTVLNKNLASLCWEVKKRKRDMFAYVVAM